MLGYLIEKEFKLAFRDAIIPRITLVMPLVIMLVMPLVADMEMKSINICIADSDRSGYSARLTGKIAASPRFVLAGLPATYREAMSSIEAGAADMILEIPFEFERSLASRHTAHVTISANSTDAVRGGMGSSYLTGILNDFARELHEERSPAVGMSAAPAVTVQNMFNLRLDYKTLMIPALMVMLLTLMCGFLPALSIVGEKESGTIEQMNVTPVGKFTFIFAKLIPFWVIGFVTLFIAMTVAALLYGLVPAGSLAVICLLAAIYILAMSGMGLMISNYSNTMQQAMLIMFFFMMIMLMMSGLFTPVSSMPQWAQAVTVIDPLKYFIDAMRLVYLKGSSLSQLGRETAALLVFAAVFNGWAIWSYKKRK
ncbi:MAG: ABC transporter permease [Bacteroidales bacterium]|jgi:ABC-2 type transport system permease protein|nr:ABC transporter permease [Bacteroidales bacterium]